MKRVALGGRLRRLSAGVLALVVAASTFVGVINSNPAAADASELYSWGYNLSGQLGNGTTANATAPSKVSLPTGVSATGAAAGSDHSMAIGSDGKVYAFGDNSNGQLGNGTTTGSATPVVVSMPSGVTAIKVAAGVLHSVALGSDGNVYDWGYNGYGQLGNGSLVDSSTPIKVSLGTGVVVTSIAAGAYFTLALTSAGNVYGWGYGAQGTLCDGKVTNPQKTPAEATVSNIAALAAGGYHSLFLTNNSILYACGYNAFGQLGNGTTTNHATRVAVSMPSGVTATSIAAGQYHSLATGSNGKLYAWGENANGQLGNGTTTNSLTPAEVSMPSGVTATSINAGNTHSVAIGSDGNLYAWGYNGLGELGDGNTTEAHTPTEVSLPAVANPATILASGSSADHSLAVASPTPALTVTSLSASPNPAVYGQTVTLTASLNRNDGGGSMAFKKGSTTISGCGAVSLSLVGGTYKASCSTVPSAGTYSLTAIYSGDSLYASSTSSAVSLMVSAAPLSITASSGTMTYGGSVSSITA
ncbi:MAG TPA: Ig-like domain repeat protein, partial [Acidimicrobiales bacterium]|nr:Ig-like domain repeat protein [Acidimicrobiales bacterium]